MLKENLVRCRKMNGWTQQELADKSGFSRSSIINWETGKRVPRSVDVEKLAEVLDTSTAYLMGEINNSNFKQNKKEYDDYQNISYWGGIVDNVRKIIESGENEKISLAKTLLNSALNLFIENETANLPRNQKIPYLDVRQTNIGRDATVNSINSD